MQTVEPTATGPAGPSIAELGNNDLIIRLLYTTNHLSRWLTPIHDQTRLARSLRRGRPSVKELLLELRDEELRIFPKMYLIMTRNMPNLDKLPPVERTAAQSARDEVAAPLSVMSEFRRLRQSTCSLLRGLPDDAWLREGISRREHDWTLRGLAEHLARHDLVVLREIDMTLDELGVRNHISPAARVHLDELLAIEKIAPRQY